MASQCASGAENSVIFQVPFAFVVAGRTMPAGSYTVETSGSIVAVRGSGSSVLVASGPPAIESDLQPGLIFSKHGGASYLVGVRTEDDFRSIGPGAPKFH